MDMMIDEDVKQIRNEIEREIAELKQHPKSKARWCTEPYAKEHCEDCKMWNLKQQDCQKFCD